MCKKASELISLLDEMAASAASMHKGPQNYDNFIRSRDLCKEKVQSLFDRERALCSAITHLNSLIQ